MPLIRHYAAYAVKMAITYIYAWLMRYDYDRLPLRCQRYIRYDSYCYATPDAVTRHKATLMPLLLLRHYMYTLLRLLATPLHTHTLIRH